MVATAPVIFFPYGHAMKRNVQSMDTGLTGVTLHSVLRLVLVEHRFETVLVCMILWLHMVPHALEIPQIPKLVTLMLVQWMDNGETGMHGMTVVKLVVAGQRCVIATASSR